MARPNDGSVKALKDAFDRGYNSHFVVEKNNRGFYVNPSNPYIKGTLTYKEFERGNNIAFSDAQRLGYDAVKPKIQEAV